MPQCHGAGPACARSDGSPKSRFNNVKLTHCQTDPTAAPLSSPPLGTATRPSRVVYSFLLLFFFPSFCRLSVGATSLPQNDATARYSRTRRPAGPHARLKDGTFSFVCGFVIADARSFFLIDGRMGLQCFDCRFALLIHFCLGLASPRLGITRLGGVHCPWVTTGWHRLGRDGALTRMGRGGMEGKRKGKKEKGHGTWATVTGVLKKEKDKYHKRREGKKGNLVMLANLSRLCFLFLFVCFWSAG